jgi:hypothetical protein
MVRHIVERISWQMRRCCEVRSCIEVPAEILRDLDDRNRVLEHRTSVVIGIAPRCLRR